MIVWKPGYEPIQQEQQPNLGALLTLVQLGVGLVAIAEGIKRLSRSR